MVLGNNSLSGDQIWKGFGRLFYLVDPKETSFPDLASLPPSYTAQATPFFAGLIALEWTILLLKGEKLRLTDGLFSVAHGLIMMLMQAFLSGLLFSCYIYIHTNYCILALPWDSTITWVCAAVGVDFCYYWIHRAAHEINLLWAAHQVHHSSEEYNLTTALRQSAFQSFGSWPFNLPLAFFIPPTQAIVHMELNLLYQFWIHTGLVRSIGPLEYIFNTASHHRVHHGANQYCLDKNYAGVLIIWDRIFGTFEAERPDVGIVYGLVDQPQFWNPVKHQIFYYGKVLEKARSMSNWADFFSAFIKGPGWFPGTGRLGDISFVPENPQREKYCPPVSPLLHLYTLTHFLLSFLAIDTLLASMKLLSQFNSILLIIYNLWGLTSIGLLYDNNSKAWISEVIRCTLSLIIIHHQPVTTSIISPYVLQVLYSASSLIAVFLFSLQLAELKNVKKE